MSINPWLDKHNEIKGLEARRTTVKEGGKVALGNTVIVPPSLTRRQRLGRFIGHIGDWYGQTTGISDMDLFVGRLSRAMRDPSTQEAFVDGEVLANPLLADKFLSRVTKAFGEPIYSVKDAYDIAASPKARTMNEHFDPYHDKTMLRDYYIATVDSDGNSTPVVITDPATKDRTLLMRPEQPTTEGVLYAFSGGQFATTPDVPLSFTVAMLPRAEQQ